jgi:hypothetical protein
VLIFEKQAEYGYTIIGMEVVSNPVHLLLDVDPEKLDVDPEKLDVDPEKLDVDPEKLDVDPEKLDVVIPCL